MYHEEEGLELQREHLRGEKRSTGPRSRIVEAIAVLLLARPMRAAEIASALGYPTRYVSSYLSYWKTRGLFDYENGFWTLTDEGEEYARSIVEKELNSRVAQYAALAKKILLEQEKISLAVNDKATTPVAHGSGRLLPFTATSNVKRDKKRLDTAPRRRCAEALLTELELSADERTVLEALLGHYVQWGSTYTYLDHLEQELEADRVWLLGVLRLLQAKQLVYIYTDRRLGVRVGLSRRLRNALRDCEALA